MSKKSGSARQRAKKKHAREAKRKSAQPKRPPSPSITTLAALEALLDHGVDTVDAWLGHFYELAMDLGGQAPDLTRRVAAVLRDVAQQLSGEPAEWQMFLAEDQARLLAGIGAKAEGEQALRATIAHLPPDAGHYIILVDFLTDDESEDPHDLRGALEALEAAKATLTDQKQHWSFDERIAELRERLDELGEDDDGD